MRNNAYDDLETPAEAENWLRKVRGEVSFYSSDSTVFVTAFITNDRSESIRFSGSGKSYMQVINKVRESIWRAGL